MEIKSFTAKDAIPAHRLVKFDSTGTVALATSGSDALIGISDDIDVSAGNMADIHLLGLCKVQFGGTVAAGAVLTAGTGGKAVTAGSNDAVLGIALQAATADEIGYCVIRSLGTVPEQQEEPTAAPSETPSEDPQ